MKFSEADWTHLMSLCHEAPDRYAERVREEARAVLARKGEEATVQLADVMILMRRFHERRRKAFDPEKLGPIDRLTSLLWLDLITKSDLDGFSAEVRDNALKLRAIIQKPREREAPAPISADEVPPPRMLVVNGREVEVRVLTGLPDDDAAELGTAPYEVGLEVAYQGESKIVEFARFSSVPGWRTIAYEVGTWVDREDPWSWGEEAAP